MWSYYTLLLTNTWKIRPQPQTRWRGGRSNGIRFLLKSTILEIGNCGLIFAQKTLFILVYAMSNESAIANYFIYYI